ncbi:MAG: hypothetical protein NTX65_11570 [Ignavibacteriales bacterium]|nr:hypothetical protein [Ignavibacteriales bacterium]
MATILQVLNRALKDEKFWDQLLVDSKKALDSANFKLSQEDLIYLMDRIHDPVTVVKFERRRHESPAPKEVLVNRKMSKISKSETAENEFLDSEEIRVPWS